jgi:rod shape-determining protein MreC
MRNLLAFLVKNYYLFLFLFLETIAIFLLVSNNSYQRAGFINSSNAVAGSIYETWSGVTDYLSLKHTNERLAEENALLRNQLKSSKENYTVDSIRVTDTINKRKYLYIPARVVNNSTNRSKNYLTLNRGSDQGVRRLMGVISGDGVVGIVQEVSGNFCTVRSVLHTTTRVPASIERFGENTILTWDGSSDFMGKIERVPSQLRIVKGDTVLTSPYSTIFPPGIMVGVVEEVTPIPGITFNNLKVRLSTPFSKLSYVYVVNNLFQQEQDSIERETQLKEKQQQ